MWIKTQDSELINLDHVRAVLVQRFYKGAGVYANMGDVSYEVAMCNSVAEAEEVVAEIADALARRGDYYALTTIPTKNAPAEAEA